VLGITLFVLSAVFILYVVLGYPVLLALLARLRTRPVRKRFEERTVSILLPVRNGERWIVGKLASIAALDYSKHLLEVIVVCDGCEDGTEELARSFSGIDLQVISIPRSGKSAALNHAIQRARGEILFFTDVRQALSPESLMNLVACFADPTVGVASGELIIREGATRAEANVGLYWKYEKWIRKRLSRIDSVLGATGCIYAMRAGLATPLAPDAILDDVNLPLGAFFQGYRVILEDTAHAYDEPASLDIEFRRKVRTLAGVYQTIRAFPALLGPHNRMWIHFMSHKLGRLLLPWALIVLLLSSFTLPYPWGALALAAQAAFYLTALLDLGVPEASLLKRLTSPVRTFVVLVVASLSAVSIVFLPRRVLWGETRARSAAG
jgi:cellulose synthase/poly-beta-1,6-N-acetylglucosamine synthase-like glycosyltransferase